MEAVRSSVERDAEPILPEYSEESIALMFAQVREGELAYVAGWSGWMRYHGHRWQRDDTLAIYDFVRQTVREFAGAENFSEKSRVKIASASTVAAVERLARSDRRIAATVEQWDADPWVLNTPDGRIDLKTGVRFGHSPSACMTKITAVGPAGDCPLWRKVLDRWTGGDNELQQYLQRLAGYALTGSTKEHTLAFFYGPGGNGKSKFLDTISSIMGDYAKTAGTETFTASRWDRHPTELASLCGARLVTANETEQGREWAEARIKALTGGDRISARYMHRDPFEFKPQFKLVIAGNHKPALRNVDEAMQRRFHMIPFTAVIPAVERDLDLSDKLQAEWGGILQWMIDGCLQWQKTGLQPPPVVTKATAEYLDQQDSLQAWMAERCQVGADYRCGIAELFKSWSAWALAGGIAGGTRVSFADKLLAKGFHNRRTNTGATFFGIRVTPEMLGECP